MTHFHRLILALPPPPPGPIPDPELPTAPSTGPASTAPRGHSSDSYSAYLRSDETLAPYLTGRNPRDMAESVRSWFQGESPQAVEARGNYIARDTALSLTFIAFHDSRNLAERRQLQTYFVEGAQGVVETLRLLRRESRPEAISESADALLRLSILIGLFLRDLEGSEIPQAERQRCQDELRQALRQAYEVIDGAVGTDHPEWRHLQEFVRAMNLAQNPPAPSEAMGRYMEWIREIHGHLNEAEAALSPRSEYRDEITSFIQSARAELPPLPGSDTLARGFITSMTANFLTLIAGEIDQEDGDSAERVQSRYQNLTTALEAEIAAHPGESFEASLNRLRSPEADHLRSVIGGSALLTELVQADRNALETADGLTTGQIVSRWGEGVLTRLEAHSLNWGENFMARGEQHLGSTRAILQLFRTGGSETPSLSAALANFAGRDPETRLSDRLSRRADAEWHSLNSTGFGVASGASHFFSIRTVPFVAGGALLSRLSTWGLFAGAGESGQLVLRGIPAIRSVPVLRSIPFLGRTALIEGGEMTGAGRFASATLTGTGLSLGFSGHQLARDLAAGRPEAWGNFGRNLGLGILVNSAALGLSALMTSGLRRALATPRGAAGVEAAASGRFSTLLERLVTPGRAVFYYGSHAAIGTAGMIGTNAIIRGIHNAGLPEDERVPYTGADEITETYLNLIAMNLAELPLQRIAMRRQLGRFRTSQLETLSREILSTSEGPLTRDASRSQEQIFQFLALRALRGVPLETLRSEAFRNYVARTLLPGTEASATALNPANGGETPGTQGASASGPYRVPGSPGASDAPAAPEPGPPPEAAVAAPRPTIQAPEARPGTAPAETSSSPAVSGRPASAAAAEGSSTAAESGDETATITRAPSGDATVTARVPPVPGTRPSRPIELTQTIPGTSSDSTQILSPHRSFLIRLRDRIQSTRSPAERRYVIVTLRETGAEFDPEGSLRSVRYQETLPEPRPHQIVLERQSDAQGRPRIVLIRENYEGVSTETQSFMRLLMEPIFPRVEPAAPRSVAPEGSASSGAAPADSSPVSSDPPPPPAGGERPAAPAATEETMESVFAGLAAEVEGAAPAGGTAPAPEGGAGSGTHPRIPTPVPPPISSSPEVAALSDPFGTPPPRPTPDRVPVPARPEPAPREESPADPTQRIHAIELRTQAAIMQKLSEYFAHPIPGLLRLIQDAEGRRHFEWIPGGLAHPPPPLGGRILAAVRITGDLTRDPTAFEVVPSLGQEQWGRLITSAMQGIVRNHTYSRGR